jgi:ketosteroid isomerase-like protein
MRNPNCRKVLLCLVMLSWASILIPAQSPDLRSELVALVNSELAFSKASLDKGMHAAFLSFLAEQSVVFRPQPVDGRSFYSDIRDSIVLSWYPVVADISRTADLGYTTGPYESRTNRPGGTPNVGHGYYVSLWSKQKDGAWKVVLDIGTSNPAPKTKPRPWQPPASYRPVFDQPVSDAQDQREVLMKMDQQCTTISKNEGAPVAYAAFVAEDARLHLPLRQPILGKLQILASIGSKEFLAWQPKSAEVARGADLGYTYGKRTNPARIGQQYYVRIWKPDRAGKWKIVLEVVTTPERVEIAK